MGVAKEERWDFYDFIDNFGLRKVHLDGTFLTWSNLQENLPPKKIK